MIAIFAILSSADERKIIIGPFVLPNTPIAVLQGADIDLPACLPACLPHYLLNSFINP